MSSECNERSSTEVYQYIVGNMGHTYLTNLCSTGNVNTDQPQQLLYAAYLIHGLTMVVQDALVHRMLFLRIVLQVAKSTKTYGVR